MHRHHPHLAAGALQLALDRDVQVGEGLGQALQVGDPGPFRAQHLGQELVEHFLRLAAQPGQDAGAHRAALSVGKAEQAREEVEGPPGAGLGLTALQEG